MSYLDWHVGMKVVCVDPLYTWSEGSELEKGRVYTIRAIGPWVRNSDPSVSLSVGVWLAEIHDRSEPDFLEDGDIPFRASRFRPVKTRKTDISIFTAMLTHIPTVPA